MVVLGIIGIACIGLLLFMYIQAHENNLRIHEFHTEGEQETVCLFFISDTHARKIDETMIASIRNNVDAVIIGGDFVDRRTTEETLLHNIQLLTKLGPTFFVWGNNDAEFGEEKIRQLFAQYNIRLLENEAAVLPCKNNVQISGLTYRLKKDKLEGAAARYDEKTTVLATHNPQVLPEVYQHLKPLLSVAGHLHGGQIRLGNYGIQPRGHFRNQGSGYELVSNGYGTTLLPLRLGAKPECHLICIHFGKNSFSS